MIKCDYQFDSNCKIHANWWIEWIEPVTKQKFKWRVCEHCLDFIREILNVHNIRHNWGSLPRPEMVVFT